MKFVVIYPPESLDVPDVVLVDVEPRDAWNAGTTIARMALPLLQAYRVRVTGYPLSLTYEEWLLCLDEMIWGFQAIVDSAVDRDLLPEEFERVQRAMELFGKHFLHLWD